MHLARGIEAKASTLKILSATRVESPPRGSSQAQVAGFQQPGSSSAARRLAVVVMAQAAGI